MWEIIFYNARLKADLEKWPIGIYASFLRLVGVMHNHGTNLRMPHSRALGNGLFELRCKGREGIGRAFYCTLVGRKIVILHQFIKKTENTPDHELRIARQRLKEVLDEN